MVVYSEISPPTSKDRTSPTRVAWPKTTGDYSADCKTGARLADDLIKTMKERQAPPLLHRAIRHSMPAGVFSGVEIGFFNQIATRLILSD
jgi:hypothetical protein